MRAAPGEPPEPPDWGTGGITVQFPRVCATRARQVLRAPPQRPQAGRYGRSDGRQDPLLQRRLRQPDRPRTGRLLPDAKCRSRSHHAADGRFAVEPLAPLHRDHGHYGPPLPPADRQRIYAWIDANVPYYGTYEHHPAWRPACGSRDGWDMENPHGWLAPRLAPVFQRRCVECHRRTVYGQAAYNSKRVEVTSRIWTDRGLTDDMAFTSPLAFLIAPEFRINLSRPEHSLLLTAPLAKEAGGFGLCRMADESPVFRGRTDPDYQALLAAIRGRGPHGGLSAGRMAATPDELRQILDCEVRDIRIHEFSSEYVGPGLKNGKAVGPPGRVSRQRQRRGLHVVARCVRRARRHHVADGRRGQRRRPRRLPAAACVSTCALRATCADSHLELQRVASGSRSRREGYRDPRVGRRPHWRPLGPVTLDRAPGGRTWPQGPDGCQDFFVAGRRDGVPRTRLDIYSNHNGSDYRQGRIRQRPRPDRSERGEVLPPRAAVRQVPVACGHSLPGNSISPTRRAEQHGALAVPRREPRASRGRSARPFERAPVGALEVVCQTAPVTFRPAGKTTSNGKPFTWLVIGQKIPRPVL